MTGKYKDTELVNCVMYLYIIISLTSFAVFLCFFVCHYFGIVLTA